MDDSRLTHDGCNRILTNAAVWSPDGNWIVCDTRSDRMGAAFDGSRIEMVNLHTREVRLLYESRHGAHCGVASFSPVDNRVVFILGPENPNPDWTYREDHRRGVLIDIDRPGEPVALDARDISAPYTPGALRGGSHVHMFSPDGEWLSFTYNDAVLHETNAPGGAVRESDQRNVAVCFPRAVRVPQTHSRNHESEFFTAVVTLTHDDPEPGSDQIRRACEESWIGRTCPSDSGRRLQERALAFQGELLTKRGEPISEVFVVDIPEDITAPGALGPLQGTETTRPRPPAGTRQRRLTHTADRKYPGLQGARHWLRSSPDGAEIACLMRDERGIVQIWLASTTAGEPRRLTRDDWNVESAFTWRPDGTRIAYAADNSIFSVDVENGKSCRLTVRSDDDAAPLPLACVYSPDGRRIAYMRSMHDRENQGRTNNVFVVRDDG